MLGLDTNTLIALVGGVTGLIGTISGAAIAYLSLKHTLDSDRHRIKVKLSQSHLINHPTVSSNQSQFVIHVANLGNVPFTVANVGIQIGHYSGGLAIPSPTGTHPLGEVLARDKTCNFWSPYDDAVETVKGMTKRSRIKVRAHVSDYAGNRFSSDWHPLQLRQTRRSKVRGKLHKWRLVVLKFLFS